jgi:hypothetical protein
MYALSQIVCHIKTVRCRTVQFSMKAVPDGQCTLVHSNTTVYCVIISLGTLMTSALREPAPRRACLLPYNWEVWYLNMTFV